MAKRHLILEFLQVQNEYVQYNELLKDYQKMAQSGKLLEENFAEFRRQYEEVRAKYDMWAYIMMLLNKPNKRSKQEDKLTQEWYKYLGEDVESKKALIDESANILAEWKKKTKQLLKDLIDNETRGDNNGI